MMMKVVLFSRSMRMAALALVASLPVLAAESGNLGIVLSVEQGTHLRQVDPCGPQHITSKLAIDVESFFFGPPMDPPFDVAPDLTLPDGATGSISKADFTIAGGTTASYLFESAVDDFSGRFPTGEHSITFSTPDAGCAVSFPFERAAFVGDGSLRPRVLNQNWHDGMLSLPKENLVLRWDRMAPGIHVAGDTESVSQVVIYDAETRQRVFRELVGDPNEGVRYPMFLLGEHQGVDLSMQAGIVAGKVYDVDLEKQQTTIIIQGDSEIEILLTSRVSFKLFVDPAAPAAPLPSLQVTTDDEDGTVSIRWTPHQDTAYIVSAGLTNELQPQPLAILTAPEKPGADLVFTQAMSSARRFFRIFPIPK